MWKNAFALSLLCIVFSCEKTVDEIDESQEDHSNITIEITDSIGVEIGDSSFVFGSIADVEILHDTILVLDGTYCNLRMFSRDGEYISTIGSRGEGPGELIHPINIFNWGDGTAGIMDPNNGGIHRFSLTGEWLGLDLAVTQNIHVDPFIMPDGQFVCFKTRFDPNGDTMNGTALTGRFSLSEEPLVTYWEKTRLWDFNNMGNLTLDLFFYNSFTADQESGRVYVSPFDEDNYTILCFNADGSATGTISGEHTPVAKTPEEIEREKDFIAFTLGFSEGVDNGFNYDCDPWPNHLPVTGLYIGPEGNLWARKGGTEVPTFDIWNNDLELVGTATIPEISGDGSSFKMVFGEEYILAWDENPEDFQKIYILDLPH